MTPFMALLGLPIGAFLGYLVLIGVQEGRKVNRCPQCHAKFTGVQYWPTKVVGVDIPEYICPNGHSRTMQPGSDETLNGRLGGWQP